MTRLVNYTEMTPDEILECSYTAMAIVEICAGVADNIDDLRGKQSIDYIGANLSLALKSAHSLMVPVHDHHESRQAKDKNGVVTHIV